ncbi:uncharacterized protein LOC110691765, partial [Chenopodium quinoa]|uniref:uncharacterized protein LOC110691765 n=1 Tax=Chenopodium quinoa TaxID=63459 RepID=UPI000B780299
MRVIDDETADVDYSSQPNPEELQDSRERRRRLNFLNYEALKRELQFMTLGIGAACTGYCLFIFSIQAAVSYASGVGFSFLYLQLLYQHADNISQDSVPQIFRQKKTKKIGIRSEDLKDSLEKSVKGSGIALSSPRLVIRGVRSVFGLDLVQIRSNPKYNSVFNFPIR